MASRNIEYGDSRRKNRASNWYILSAGLGNFMTQPAAFSDLFSNDFSELSPLLDVRNLSFYLNGIVML